jgi:hypothetical protein
MFRVVQLRWGEQPATAARYVMITRLSRTRGEDYYVHTRSNRRMGDAHFWADESYASLTSALRQAENVAAHCGADTIYVRQP